jgi:hypothetical protein
MTFTFPHFLLLLSSYRIDVQRKVAPNTTNVIVGNGVYLDPNNDQSTTYTITRGNGDPTSTASVTRFPVETAATPVTTTLASGATDSPNYPDTSGVTVTPDASIDTASPAQAFAIPTMTA